MIGETVSRYRIEAQLGAGGMGVVYRAHDIQLGRDVALKFLPPRLLADEAALRRFRREAELASSLNHPNICIVHDVDQHDGRPFIVMELCHGQSAKQLLKQGPVPVAQAVDLAMQMAGALDAAHQRGIVHRDIKPANLFVSPSGQLKVLDFGLAKLSEADELPASPTDDTDRGADEATELTRPGMALGTVAYMSPEQALGQVVDPRSDLFSLGAVLYEMCTGRRAFAGEHTGSINEAILTTQPVSLSSIDPSLPAELDRIVRRALEKRASDRHKDARELHADLVGLLRQVESADYVPSSRPTTVPRARAAWMAGVAALAVMAAVAAAMWPGHAPPPSFAGGAPRQITSEQGPEMEPAISPDGGLIAYTARRGEESDIWISDIKGGSRLRLTGGGAASESPAWFPDGAAIAFVSDRSGKPSVWKVPKLGGTPVLVAEGAIHPAISPDGLRLAFSRENAAGHYRIAVAPLDDPARASWLTSGDEGEHHQAGAAWSPDGRSLCFSDSRNLWLVGSGGGRAQHLTSDNAVDTEPAWSSDGRYVIFTSQREGTRALWRVAVDGGRPERITFGTGPESHPSVSSDGTRLAYSTYSDDYDVVLLDRATGAKERIGSELYDASPSFAPDATSVVFTSNRRGGQFDLWVQPVAGGKRSGAPRQLTDLAGSVSTPACSPDGKWVAFKRELPSGREIWVVPAGGGLPQRVSDGAGRDMQPAWSPDGRWLAYVSRRGEEANLFAVPLAEGRPSASPRALTRGDTTDSLPEWSADGRRIAYVRATSDGAEVWTVPALGGVAAGPLVRSSQIGRLRWEKGGDWLWFSAVEARGGARLKKVRPGQLPAEPVEALAPEVFADAWSPGDFDLSADGRLLAFTRQEVRGDVWLLENKRGAY